MNHWIRLCALFFFAIAIEGVAQNEFITLSGKITDAQTAKPIPFASIRLKTGSAGTASNVEGDFIFKIPKAALPDTLLISSIGYQSSSRVLSTEEKTLMLKLEPAVIELQEIT